MQIERDIAWTSAFKRDFKREKKTDQQLESLLAPVLSMLAADAPLEAKYRDPFLPVIGIPTGIAISSLILF